MSCKHGNEYLCRECWKETVESSLVERRVMGRTFIDECIKKFGEKAEANRRSLKPEEEYATAWLLERLSGEVEELVAAADEGDPEAIMGECLDVANFAHFIYEQAKAAIKTGP
jgi:NTP pyrophosphatase (non-canonical NTP hydrolase)